MLSAKITHVWPGLLNTRFRDAGSNGALTPAVHIPGRGPAACRGVLDHLAAKGVNLPQDLGLVPTQRRVGEALLEYLLLLGIILLVADADQVARAMDLVRIRLSDVFELPVDIWQPNQTTLRGNWPGVKSSHR